MKLLIVFVVLLLASCSEPMRETESPFRELQKGDSVTVNAVTGKVIASVGDGIEIEYVDSNGVNHLYLTYSRFI